MKAPLFLLQLRNECTKLFSRKRTYLGFAAFLLADVLLIWLSKQPLALRGIRSLMLNNGLRVEEYSGGLSLAAATLVLTVALLSGLYLALVSGDLIAREIEEGTMRMVLARPINRLRLFIIKALVGALHTFLLMLFIGLSALLVGWILQGRLGKMLVYAPLEGGFGIFSPMEGLRRYLLAILLIAFLYQAVSAMALMFSCLRLRPATATVLTLSVLYVDYALNNIPYLAAFKPWFLSFHLSSWLLVFRYHIPWPDIAGSLLVIAGLSASFLVIGFSFFASRDIKT
ncbi:MAG: ABC transporter permease [Verrucomicrobiota bacterium]